MAHHQAPVVIQLIAFAQLGESGPKHSGQQGTSVHRGSAATKGSHPDRLQHRPRRCDTLRLILEGLVDMGRQVEDQVQYAVVDG